MGCSRSGPPPLLSSNSIRGYGNATPRHSSPQEGSKLLDGREFPRSRSSAHELGPSAPANGVCPLVDSKRYHAETVKAQSREATRPPPPRPPLQHVHPTCPRSSKPRALSFFFFFCVFFFFFFFFFIFIVFFFCLYFVVFFFLFIFFYFFFFIFFLFFVFCFLLFCFFCFFIWLFYFFFLVILDLFLLGLFGFCSSIRPGPGGRPLVRRRRSPAATGVGLRLYCMGAPRWCFALVPLQELLRRSRPCERNPRGTRLAGGNRGILWTMQVRSCAEGKAIESIAKDWRERNLPSTLSSDSARYKPPVAGSHHVKIAAGVMTPRLFSTVSAAQLLIRGLCFRPVRS